MNRRVSHADPDRRPRNWWSFTECIRNRNNSQEPESETRDNKNKSDQEGTMKERNNPRKNNPVEYSKHGKFHKNPITSVLIPETSQDIISSSHKVTDMS